MPMTYEQGAQFGPGVNWTNDAYERRRFFVWSGPPLLPTTPRQVVPWMV